MGTDRQIGHLSTFTTAFVLGVLVLTGTLLRLDHLGSRSISQAEIYVPRIPLPAAASDPPARMTVLAILTGTMWDVHPPTWYVGMWFWTKAVGIRLTAIRLPSVLFGALGILLTYWVAALETDRQVAISSAALLAFNGHHIFFSQIARQYTMVCFVGLLATAFLQLAVRPGRWQLVWASLYGAAAVLGLATLYYFWVLFLSQMLWVILNAYRQRTFAHGLLRLQLFALILAMPVITIAIFQSRASYLGQDAWQFFSDFARFSFLFEPDSDVARPFSDGWNVVFLIASILLLGIGVVAMTRSADAHHTADNSPGPSLPWLTTAACWSVLVIALATVVFRTKKPDKTWQLLAVAAGPLLAVAMAFGARWFASVVARKAPSTNDRFPVGSLIALLAIVPPALVALISIRMPFLASNGMLLFTPYLVIVLASGLWAIVRVGGLARATALVLIVGLALAHVASVRYQRGRSFGVQDYQGLAAAWVPELRDGDVIFAPRHWTTTPVFYYLDARRYVFVGQDFDAAMDRSAPTRVWVLLPEATSMPSSIAAALHAFRPARQLRARRLAVELYERPAL